MGKNVQIEWGVRIPMRDGIHLAADLYKPGNFGTTPLPAIVVRTPYGRITNERVQQGRYFAEHGYVVVQVDVRGRGDSEGVFIPYRNEGVDGYDTIEWVAAEPWCSGSVGTLGGSYLGRVQWLTALEQPPHLKAMIPLVTPSDPFVEWPTGTMTPMHLCWLFLTSGRMVQNVDAVDWMEAYGHLPLVEMDAKIGRYMPAWHEELEHTYLDDWWRKICYQTRLNEIDVPVMHISGWYDDEQVGTPRNFTGMTTNAPSDSVRKGQRLIMGPWGHNVNASTKVDNLDFGPSAIIDLNHRQRQFFDYWLKAEKNGEDKQAPVSIFVMGENVWREENEWPLARTEFTRWYLHSEDSANSSFGDGKLRPEFPSETAKPDSYVYDPLNPVPFITEPTSSQIGGPDDYRPIHRRDDVLVYTSDALTEAIEVTGPIVMEVFASSTAPDTDFMAQLHDVHPNGTVQRIIDGMVRLRFRNGFDKPELLEPGTVVKLDIDCWYTSHVFQPGHRIRVHVTSSAFPKYDRNENTGNPLGQSAETQVATQTVYHDAMRPSAIVLPVIPRG